MIDKYLDVVLDDVYRLLCKKGRASDAEYWLIIKRLNIVKEELSEKPNES